MCPRKRHACRLPITLLTTLNQIIQKRPNDKILLHGVWIGTFLNRAIECIPCGLSTSGWLVAAQQAYPRVGGGHTAHLGCKFLQLFQYAKSGAKRLLFRQQNAFYERIQVPIQNVMNIPNLEIDSMILDHLVGL